MRVRSAAANGIMAARRADKSGDELIHVGERERAHAIIKEWAAKASTFIKITDPFFGVEELEFVNLIRGVNQSIPIQVLTSRKHQQDTGVRQPWDETYQSHWRMMVSDSDPGDVSILMIGKGAHGEHPIHDRWWLSEKTGLRIGSSVNSLGTRRVSEVSYMSEGSVREKLIVVDSALNGSLSSGDSERIRYSSFKL